MVLRLIVLIAGFALLSVVSAAGWADPPTATRATLTVYWLLMVGTFLWTIFGVAIPVLSRLKGMPNQSKLAHFLTLAWPSQRNRQGR